MLIKLKYSNFINCNEGLSKFLNKHAIENALCKLQFKNVLYNLQ